MLLLSIYNAKLVGIPELKSLESSLETSKLCVQLFRAMGVAGTTLEDIDIAHRVPARKDSKYKPIICKLSRRIFNDQVINCRRDINKVNPNTVNYQKPEGLIISPHDQVYRHSYLRQKNFNSDMRTSSVG